MPLPCKGKLTLGSRLMILKYEMRKKGACNVKCPFLIKTLGQVIFWKILDVTKKEQV